VLSVADQLAADAEISRGSLNTHLGKLEQAGLLCCTSSPPRNQSVEGSNISKSVAFGVYLFFGLLNPLPNVKVQRSSTLIVSS
jgi:hypothetical protein